MHIVVCIKQVPDTTEVRIDPKTNTLIREGVPSIINPFDVHAIEEAVRLKEKYGGRVSVISMGPPQAKDALKRAVSFGIDQAILLSDRAFAGSDTLATSYTLTQAIHRLSETESVELILCGKQAIDGDTAQVGPGIATRLKFNQLTYVMNVTRLDLKKKEITVERKLEEGREIIRASLPALLTVVKEINPPRFANLPDWLRSLSYEVPLWNKDAIPGEPKKLGFDGSPTTVDKIFAPPPRGTAAEMITEKDPRAAVKQLVEKLTASRVVS